MNREEKEKFIHRVFERLAEKREIAFIPFVLAGYPSLDTSLALARALVVGGADLIELGMPFSDPVADGPVIAAASARALERGITLNDYFEILEKISSEGRVPVISFLYANFLETYGKMKLLQKLASLGASGLIVPDLPFDERERYFSLGSERKISEKELPLPVIPLIAPTTSRKRMEMLAEERPPFVYYISVRGVTGIRSEMPEELFRRLEEVKELVKTRVVVGFGISRPRHIVALAGRADGAVAGSALLARVEKDEGIGKAIELAKRLKWAARFVATG